TRRSSALTHAHSSPDGGTCFPAGSPWCAENERQPLSSPGTSILETNLLLPPQADTPPDHNSANFGTNALANDRVQSSSQPGKTIAFTPRFAAGNRRSPGRPRNSEAGPPRHPRVTRDGRRTVRRHDTDRTYG